MPVFLQFQLPWLLRKKRIMFVGAGRKKAEEVSAPAPARRNHVRGVRQT